MDNLTKARAFFEACDYGKGWTSCKIYCHENASFEAEAETLVEIDSLDTYCDWMVEALAMFDETVEIEVKSQHITISFYQRFCCTYLLERSRSSQQPEQYSIQEIV